MKDNQRLTHFVFNFVRCFEVYNRIALIQPQALYHIRLVHYLILAPYSVSHEPLDFDCL